MKTFAAALALVLATPASANFLRVEEPKLTSRVEQMQACVIESETKTTRKNAGESSTRFKYNNIDGEDKVCVDGSGKKYQYGRIFDVSDVNQCAYECASAGDLNLSAELRGFNYKCFGNPDDTTVGDCDCLYDDTVLTSSICSTYFDECSYRDSGKGSVAGTANLNDWVAYKLVGQEAEDIDSSVIMEAFKSPSASVTQMQVCAYSDETRPTRKGEGASRYKFNLIGTDEICVDDRNAKYQYGRFYDVTDADQCAWQCSNSGDDALDAELRGFNYKCFGNPDDTTVGDCDCLYDDVVLDDTMCKDIFDECNYSGSGKGSVSGTTTKDDWLAYKLVGAEYMNELSEEAGECTIDDSVRPTRNGERFKFNLFAEHSHCADEGGLLYEIGRFFDVDSVDDCSYHCTSTDTVSDDFAAALRGFEYNCESMNCDCLYDDGTIEDLGCDDFDNCSDVPKGFGSIVDSTTAKDWYCYKLVGAELFGEDVAQATM